MIVSTEKRIIIESLVGQLETPEEIEYLYEAIKQRRNKLAARAAWVLNIGDKVSFIGRRNMKMIGIIKDIKRTTAHINCTDGQTWRVNMAALNRIED